MDKKCINIYKVTTNDTGLLNEVREFYALGEAFAFAREKWKGPGTVSIEMPDGSQYKFNETWKTPPYKYLIRPRRGKLNPQQERLLEEWEKHSWMRLEIRRMRDCACPISKVIRNIAYMEECSVDSSAALKLFAESMDWGLFEILEYQESYGEPTRERVDYSIISKGLIRKL
jgi:hypothetical protein